MLIFIDWLLHGHLDSAAILHIYARTKTGTVLLIQLMNCIESAVCFFKMFEPLILDKKVLSPQKCWINQSFYSELGTDVKFHFGADSSDFVNFSLWTVEN